MKEAKVSTDGLEVRLLGKLELLQGGTPLPLPASKKSRALLAYLVATARPHMRERLCELLWEAPDDPRASLRWSLAKIRPLVDEKRATRLATDREQVAFESNGATIDVLMLRRELAGGVSAASITALLRAAALFRGDFLEGLDLQGCYRYHEWWVAEREQARASRVAVLAELIERLRDTPDEALAYARQLLGVDPLSEAAHVRLIRMLGDLGRTREAVAQYERCKRILAAELGTQPSPELAVLRTQLAQARLPQSGSSSLPPPQAPSTRPDDRDPVETNVLDAPMPAGGSMPLVGRARECALLDRFVTEGVRGGQRVILEVRGEAGIGKTRILEELANRVTGAGGLVLAGRAFEAEAVRPYGPWIDALRSVPLPPLTEALRADLLPLLPELDAASPPTGDKNRMFDAVAKVLSVLAPPGAPLVVVLDDIQWFDEASAALLHFVVRGLVRHGVLFAVGVRPGELADNVAAQRLLRTFAREGRLCEMKLVPLDPDETKMLVGMLTSAVDPERVFAESDGNPFFAIEVARSLEAGHEVLSGSVEQVISDRFDRLETGAAALLPWAAALGRSFRSDLLERVVPFSPSELLSAIEELEHRGILRARASGDGTTSYDFLHDLVRQAAYRQASDPRRRLVHLSIARGLAKDPDEEGNLAADVAHHAALGGDDELSVRACIAAGRRCLRIFASAEAQALADRGKQHLDRLPQQVRVSLHMQLLRLSVESGYWRNCARELESELSRAVCDAQLAGLPAEATTGWELLSELHEEAGNATRAHESINLHVQASRDADPETKLRALARAGRCLVQLEREIPKAKALLEEASQLSRGRRHDVPDIPMGLGLVSYMEGDYDAAERLLEQAWSEASRSGEHWLACEAISRLAMILLERGRSSAALARCVELKPLAAKLGEGSELPFACTLEALAKFALHEDDAPMVVETALLGLKQIDTKGHLAYALNFMAKLALDAGDFPGAKGRAEEALLPAEAVGRRTEVARSRAVLARVALQRGDSHHARAHIEAILDDYVQPLGLAEAVRRTIADLVHELHIETSAQNPTLVPTLGREASVKTT